MATALPLSLDPTGDLSALQFCEGRSRLLRDKSRETVERREGGEKEKRQIGSLGRKRDDAELTQTNHNTHDNSLHFFIIVNYQSLKFLYVHRRLKNKTKLTISKILKQKVSTNLLKNCFLRLFLHLHQI